MCTVCGWLDDNKTPVLTPFLEDYTPPPGAPYDCISSGGDSTNYQDFCCNQHNLWKGCRTIENEGKPVKQHD